MCANALHDRLLYSDFRETTLVLYLAFRGPHHDSLPRSGQFESLCLWPGPTRMRTGWALSLDVLGACDERLYDSSTGRESAHQGVMNVGLVEQSANGGLLELKRVRVLSLIGPW